MAAAGKPTAGRENAIKSWARSMMSFTERLNELRAPIWIALAILGFIVWWPLGLAILAYALWSRKMRCCGIGFGRWRDDANRQTQDPEHPSRASGNHAFDEYRAATLRRLEQEQHEFREFLARLRMAKDKAEFDQFMAGRHTRSEPQPQA